MGMLKFKGIWLVADNFLDGIVMLLQSLACAEISDDHVAATAIIPVHE